MFNNSRDALGIALMYLGYSLNTTDRDELREAADLIIAGKPVYQGIWMDQILEKLPSEEIVAAPYYNGDAVTMIDETRPRVLRPEGGYQPVCRRDVHSEEREERGGAEKFINFMCSTEAAMANWEYHRLFQSAYGRIRTARRGEPETIRCTSRTRAPTQSRAYTEPSEGHFAVL